LYDALHQCIFRCTKLVVRGRRDLVVMMLVVDSVERCSLPVLCGSQQRMVCGMPHPYYKRSTWSLPIHPSKSNTKIIGQVIMDFIAVTTLIILDKWCPHVNLKQHFTKKHKYEMDVKLIMHKKHFTKREVVEDEAPLILYMNKC
ncbi:hypothetical protein KIN20_030139, partial [Parelaphostrongylus tenuis]